MINIPLQTVPNQELSIQLDNNNYVVRIHSSNNIPLSIGTAIMTFTIIMNGEVLIENIRAVPYYPIIPFQYLSNSNFFIITNNDDYPDYNQFAISQFLIYASAAELEAIANGNI